MNRKLYLISLLILLIVVNISPVRSQKIFGGHIGNFSTMYDVYPNGWSNYQILGLPNVYPSYGDIPEAYNPSGYGAQRDFIDIGFDNHGPIDSIFIYETFTPGFVDSVFVMNPGTQNWDLVYSNPAAAAPASARILSIGFPMTTYPVNLVRMSLANNIAPGWLEYDAIAISPATTNPFTPETTAGSSYSFNGISSAYYTYSNLLNLFTYPSKTISAWVNVHQPTAPAAIGPSAGAGIICDGEGTYVGIYLANLGSGDSIYFYNYDTSDTYVGISYTPDTWMHIAYVHDNNTLKAYKNGVLMGTVSSASSGYIGTRALAMGFNQSSGLYFQGEIDEVITFDRGLNNAEINQVMRMNVPANMSGLTGYWQMSNCDESHFYNPLNHIADSMDNVSCNISGIPNFAGAELINNVDLLNIFPNPSPGIFNIQLKNIQSNYLAIFDITGRVIYQSTMTYQDLITLDLEHLPHGIYSLKIIDANQKTHTRKIIKN